MQPIPTRICLRRITTTVVGITKSNIPATQMGKPYSCKKISKDILNKSLFRTSTEQNAGGGFLCGCGTGKTGYDQQQFTAYNKPIAKNANSNSDRNIQINSYGEYGASSAGCGVLMDTTYHNTVHCPFEEFCGLLTRKLLRQISQLESHTIVEGATQNASCFFWPGGNAPTNHKEYQLQEFRTSIPLQKLQSQARSLVPVTEADTEHEAEHTRAQSEVALAASQQVVLPADSASLQDNQVMKSEGYAVEEAKN